MTKSQTIIVRIARDDLIKPTSNEMVQGGRIMRELRQRGVPIVGILAPFSVEHGRLTTWMEEGLDGDEFVFQWVGDPLPQRLRKHLLTFKTSLAAVVAAEDEM